MILDWIRLLRPAHWVKNLFVLAPLLFAQQLFSGDLWLTAVLAGGLFCAMSSTVYLLNDVVDAPRDRAHPLKSSRPIAAGRIGARSALAVACCLGLASLAGAWLVQPAFCLVGAVYLIQNVLYSLWLKRVAFVDVALIAAGFVLRVIGGALAIGVEFSSWLVVCTFFLACLLGFGKRRHELRCLEEKVHTTRPALSGYSLRSLRSAELVVAGVTLMAYLAYTVAPGTVDKFGGYNLLFTIPFPVFGIVRYLRLVESRRDLAPTDALVTDVPSLLNLISWVAVVVLVLYEVF